MSRQIAKRNGVKYIIRYLFYFILLININSCKTYNIIPEKEDTPKHDFDINLSGDTPNYSEMKCWVEHPEKAKNIYIISSIVRTLEELTSTTGELSV